MRESWKSERTSLFHLSHIFSLDSSQLVLTTQGTKMNKMKSHKSHKLTNNLPPSPQKSQCSKLLPEVFPLKKSRRPEIHRIVGFHTKAGRNCNSSEGTKRTWFFFRVFCWLVFEPTHLKNTRQHAVFSWFLDIFWAENKNVWYHHLVLEGMNCPIHNFWMLKEKHADVILCFNCTLASHVFCCCCLW